MTGTAAERDERGRRLAATDGVNKMAAQTPQSRQICDPQLMVTAYLAEPAPREANE